MTYLLDTHILLWALGDPDKLGSLLTDTISDPTNTILISSVSIAEIAIKSSIGKLTLDPELEADQYSGLLSAIAESGFESIEYKTTEAPLLASLPYHHRDPFDRMLITQAIIRGCPIITVDSQFRMYPITVVPE